MKLSLEFLLSIILNVIALGYFAGKFSATQKFLEYLFNSFKDDMEKKISDLKKDIDEKIKENKEHTAEHINRLEKKQDKHNGLIERMVKVEESTKSAHHRLDEIKDN